MPRYHFHVHSAVDAHDDEGSELADLTAAKTFATRNARFLVIEEMRRDNRFSPNHFIEIADSTGKRLHTTRYGDCVELRL